MSIRLILIEPFYTKSDEKCLVDRNNENLQNNFDT